MPVGRGSGKDAIEYLLRKTDHKGEERAEVVTIRGDPSVVAEVIDSLSSKNRYTSCVISWADEDNPTKDQQAKVVEDFKQVSFAGLEDQHCCWTAIQHVNKKGGIHIHIIAAKVHLGSGKSLNIAPPRWKKAYDPLRDMHNYLNNWARPDDPKRARLWQAGHRMFLEEKNNIKKEITEYLTTCIKSGRVANRNDIEAELSSIGQINRKGKDYISVRLKGFKRPIRLKGAIYNEEFDARSRECFANEVTGGDIENFQDSKRRAEEAEDLFKRAVAKRREYNIRRYRTPQSLDSEATKSSKGTSQFITEDINKTSDCEYVITRNTHRDNGVWVGSLGVTSNEETYSYRQTDQYRKKQVPPSSARSGELGNSENQAVDIERYSSLVNARGNFLSISRQNQNSSRTISQQGKQLGSETTNKVTNEYRDKSHVSFRVGRTSEKLRQRYNELNQSASRVREKVREFIRNFDEFRETAKRIPAATEQLFRAIDRGVKRLKIKQLSKTSKNKKSRWGITR